MSTLPKQGSSLGRFRVKRKLGASRTGVVYRAEDTLLEVPVALKIFSPALASDEMYKVISREILLTRRINHPGICRLHDLHEEKGHRFVTMDFIEGPTLDALLQKQARKGMPLPRAVRLVANIASAVNAAHQAEIVHRNLKPTNIIVGKEDAVTVLDFGHARAPGMGGGTVAKVAEEDIAYTAHEVLFGGTASEQSDQYSLGAILYRCVTGKTLLETTGPVKESTGFKGAKPARPSALNRQVTRSLEQVILTAIAANPESRFRSVAEFEAELLDTVEDLSVRSRRPRRGAVDASPPIDEPDPAVTEETLAFAENMERSTLLFSDIVGITSFFESHGDIAGRKRIELHNEILFPIIRRHGGSVLKTIGDAIMASFPDEDEAVDAAMRMQQSLDAFNEGSSSEADQIFIRIGINTGETIVEYGDAYGDAVNVAARVCSKADGEQILISEETFDDLTRNKDIINPHSEVRLKGKRDLFRLYQVDWLLADEVEPEEQDPPDLSDDGSVADQDVEPTAIVDSTGEHVISGQAVEDYDGLTAGKHKNPLISDSALDRLFNRLGLERTRGMTFAIGFGAIAILILAVVLIWLFLVGH